jgi:ABC-type nickel/cobalt efflux system permease component RcnA
MSGEGTSGIAEAFDPHAELNGAVSTKVVRVQQIKTLTKAISVVLLAAFGMWAIYSGLAMATGNFQAHIGVGVFCLLGAVPLYRAWFRRPADIGV